MSHEWYSLDELAQHLGRDRREIEKLANRGRIPGRKVSGDWQFHPTEITHWLEREMRAYSTPELAVLEASQRSEDADAVIPVASLMTLETVVVPLQARTKRSVLEGLIEAAARTGRVWAPADALQAVQEREDALSTAFENGVAIPHPRNPIPQALEQPVVAFGRTLAGIPFGAPNRGLTDLFFLVLCRDSRTHLKVLARLGRLLQVPGFVDSLRRADDGKTAYELISDADRKIGEA